MSTSASFRILSVLACAVLMAACESGDDSPDNASPADVLDLDHGTDAEDVNNPDGNTGNDVDLDEGGNETTQPDDGTTKDTEGETTTEPECKIELVPEFVNFGTSPVGFEGSRMARLVNTGTGTCNLLSVNIVDCIDNGDGQPVCPDPATAASSTVFVIQTATAEVTAPLQPGSSRNIEIRYMAPADPEDIGPAGQLWALLSFRVQDATSLVETNLPACDANCDPNLLGYVAGGQATALPVQIDFGSAVPGCCARKHTVCVYNTGITPVSMDSVSLSDCSQEFEVSGLTAMPVYIVPDNPKCFVVTYTPSGEGSDECSLRIVVNGAADPVINVPLAGSGTVEAAQVDQFVQQRSDAVDILFVIDDSGSMCDEQAALLDSFETFIERARIWNNDFHIGVINVDVQDELISGRLNLGDRQASPRFLTQSPTIVDDFSEYAAIGCDGNSSIESGLHAALTALLPPMTTDTTVACEEDADCLANPIICPTPENCPYICIEDTCGGFNKGFLRDTARLELIIMSDEDDQSVLDVDQYISMLLDLKKDLGESMVHVNVIVGIDGVPLPGDEYSACTSPGGSTAVAGTRYINAATRTDGVVASICEGSFDTAMADISQQAFTDGGRLEYFLSRLADPGTVSVFLSQDGGPTFTECETGWEYLAPTNSVALDPDGDCVPQTDALVRIQYQVLCICN